MDEIELRPHAWDDIFSQDGRVYHEVFPRFDWLVEQFALNGCKTILDLGCGSGRHLLHLTKHNFRVSGLDYSPEGLSLSKQWMEEEELNAPLVLADMRSRLPFKGGAFDGLLSTQVIHHAPLEDVRRTIAEIWRVVKPGGLIFVSVPARRHADEDNIEIEPNTFVPLEGPEKGLPHHIFSEQEYEQAFNAFQILELSTRGGQVITLLAAKPGEKGEK